MSKIKDKIMLAYTSWKFRSKKHRILNWIIDITPNWIKYYSAIQVGAYATTGEYNHQIVPDLKFMDAIERWRKDKDIRFSL